MSVTMGIQNIQCKVCTTAMSDNVTGGIEYGENILSTPCFFKRFML